MSALIKVILLENIKGVGACGSVAQVRKGYARNFLVPKQHAVLANPENMVELEKNMQILEKKNAESLKTAQAQAKSMENLQLTIACKANASDGKLFGSVNVRDVVKELGKYDIEVKSKDIDLEPIKKIGEYNVKVLLHAEVAVQVPLSVVPLQDDTPI